MITAHRTGDLLCLLMYAAISLTTVNAAGPVGEVILSGWLAHPPEARLLPDDPEAGVHRAGPLTARMTRPVESLELQVGAQTVSLPIAVNAYTGGPPDWPARLATAIHPAAGPWVAPVLGGALLLLARRFLRFHGSEGSALGVGLLLATDWGFHFYRKLLGGTEVLLLAALLLLVWSLWSRRWRSGVHGTWAISIAVGLGLLAKITFIAPLLAVGLATLLTRWDRDALLPPAPVRPLPLLLPPLLLLSPLAISAIHHALADLPPLPSHDHAGLQLGRLLSGWSGDSMARESIANLAAFLQNPASSLAAAWGCPQIPVFSPLRALGHTITLLGTALAWRARQKTPADALLRFLSLALPLCLLLITALNRDLHHLAQTTVFLALLTALAAARLAAAAAPRPLRAPVTALLLLPHLLAGYSSLQETDALIAQSPVPTFTRAGQEQIAKIVKDNLRPGEILYVVDYESYGMLEYRLPDQKIVHLWPAAARKAKPAQLLAAMKGGTFLVVRASAPFIYNWHPAGKQLEGVELIGEGEGVELYRVE